MNNLRVKSYIFFLLFVILFTIGVWNVTGTYATSVTTSESPANAMTYRIAVNQTADDGYNIPRINVNGSELTLTKPSGQLYQLSGVSANSLLTAAVAIDTLPLVLMLVVVLIIVILIIFIYRLPENKYKNIAVLDTYEMRKIASVRITIEKIRSLEEEKKSFLLEIDELDKTSESKAIALESEVNALQSKAKSLEPLELPETSVE